MGTSTDPAGSPKWGTAKQQTTSALAAGALTTAKIGQIVSSFGQGLQQTPESGFGPAVPDVPGSTPEPPGSIPAPDGVQSPRPMTAPPPQPMASPGRAGAHGRSGGGGGGGGGGGRDRSRSEEHTSEL